MKKLINSLFIIFCFVIAGTIKLYASEPPTETVIKVWEQFAKQFIADKEADNKNLSSEIEQIRNNTKISDEAKDSLAMIKEDEFTKKWNAELLKRLGEKPEYEEALKITRKLMEYQKNCGIAYDKWKEKALANNPEAYENAVNAIQTDYPFQNEWNAKLIKLVDETPELLDYPSSLIGDLLGMQVRNSDDRKLKCYSWDYHTEGILTCHCFFEQFRMADGKVMVPIVHDQDVPWWNEGDPNDEDNPWDTTMPWEWKSSVERIHTLNTGVWTVYLLETFYSAGNFRAYDCIEAKVISGTKCLDFPIFSVNGDIVTNLESAAGSNFKYDKNTKTITFDEYEERDEYDYENGGWFNFKGKAKYVLDGVVFRKR